ncbi:conserved hypothetical protein [Rubrivivax sp. A210]|uniref:hypothetical protein n=1 Tax=Rubrivivax sp. A210 TaxID=2772301 RepID=UPI00191B3474|nr:hypothetical protein [Rubrivivax sp. A210]CAD5366677.1 conserved hypothetical protein [Rubrivivax sp. A210]
MAGWIDSHLPTDADATRRGAGQRRAHRDHPAAAAVYRRLCSRTIVLTHPVPLGIRQLIADWLHRDGLVLACATYVSGNGRRLRCHAQAFAPQQWRQSAQASWAQMPVPNMRLASTPVLWPAPPGSRQMWPELPF